MSFRLQELQRQRQHYRRVVLLRACFNTTAAFIQVARQQQEDDAAADQAHQRQKRSCWTRDWSVGQYEHLLQELEAEDPKGFRIFQRLTPEVWHELLHKVTPIIEKRTTCMREPISAGLRLAITLRYLATGDNYQSQMFGFRVASNTICNIIPETCQAIFDVLSPDYFQVAFIL